MAKIYAHEEAYGKRENARSVIILITDGLSNKNSDYTKQVSIHWYMYYPELAEMNAPVGNRKLLVISLIDNCPGKQMWMRGMNLRINI